MPKIKTAFNIIRTIKNWPVYFVEYFGLYSLTKQRHITYVLRNGVKYNIRPKTSDTWVFRDVWLKMDYTPKEFQLKAKDLVLDIGAHIGMFSVFASKFATEGKIYAFEPMPENFQMLQDNIELNKITSIIPINKAVSDKKDEKELYLSQKYNSEHSFVLYENKTKKLNVKTTSLKDIMIDYSIPKIDFLKMDCEGAEYEILFNTPYDILQKIDKISMECHRVDDNRNDFSLKKFLEGNNFEISIVKVSGNLSMLYAKNKLGNNRKIR